MLSELVYVSDRNNMGDQEEVIDILKICEKNNTGKITGALLYSEMKFMQYLEGDFQDINAVYENIKIDARHKNVHLIVFSPIKEKIFPSWVMASKNIDNNQFDFHATVSVEEAAIMNKILIGSKFKQESQSTISKIIRKFF